MVFLKQVPGFVLVLLLVMVCGSLTFAEESTAISNQKVEVLNHRVLELEQKITQMEGRVSPVSGKEKTTRILPADQPVSGGLIHALQDIHMGGYIDVEYNQNLTAETANAGGNPLRSFDANQNTFSLNAAELDFQKIPNPEGGVGFRTDIAMGENNQAVDAITIGTDGDEFGLQEMYAELVSPLPFLTGNDIFSDTINFKVGRFATLAGAEVFEPLNNWNISRSFLFGLAEPASHTGIRSQYRFFKDKATAYFGLNNGWDNVIDNNMSKTLETGLNLTVKKFSETSVIYFGPETAEAGGHKRFLLSNILSWQATDKLQFLGCIDFGNERRVPGLGGHAFKNAQWHGYAGYVRYQFVPKWATAYRTEFFRDVNSYRTGLSNAAVQSLWEQTLTLEYQINDNMVGRFEYRFDKSNDNAVFNGERNQSTLGSQLIYNFA